MLKLYNTMARKIERFVPREQESVKMFTCGPSIYRRPHIGNYRSFLWEDVLQRYLEYQGHTVERVINFTDVEDKAIAEAEKEGVSVEKLTGPIAEQFYEDCKVLRIKLPDFIPRSSTCFDQAVELIQLLLQKGYAYRHGGDVFYDPLKFEGFGKLFRLDMKLWPKEKRRFRRDTYPGRRWNLGDFILWHGAGKEGGPVWDTDIGKGRPAWNIQDPAMITKHLGFSIDICCGGIDNLYRHHDYNLAVVEAASGVQFARFWVHGAHLLCRGRKMSKSLGNIVYLEDLTGGGRTADHVRFFLLYGHHRRRMNLTPAAFEKAAARLDELRGLVRRVLYDEGAPDRSTTSTVDPIETLERDFERSMSDDLDSRSAVDSLIHHLKSIERMRRSGSPGAPQVGKLKDALTRIDDVLQVLF